MQRSSNVCLLAVFLILIRPTGVHMWAATRLSDFWNNVTVTKTLCDHLVVATRHFSLILSAFSVFFFVVSFALLFPAHMHTCVFPSHDPHLRHSLCLSPVCVVLFASWFSALSVWACICGLFWTNTYFLLFFHLVCSHCDTTKSDWLKEPRVIWSSKGGRVRHIQTK